MKTPLRNPFDDPMFDTVGRRILKAITNEAANVSPRFLTEVSYDMWLLAEQTATPDVSIIAHAILCTFMTVAYLMPVIAAGCYELDRQEFWRQEYEGVRQGTPRFVRNIMRTVIRRSPRPRRRRASSRRRANNQSSSSGSSDGPSPSGPPHSIASARGAA